MSLKLHHHLFTPYLISTQLSLIVNLSRFIAMYTYGAKVVKGFFGKVTCSTRRKIKLSNK